MQGAQIRFNIYAIEIAGSEKTNQFIISDMPEPATDNPSYQWIDQPEQLVRLIETLNKQNVVAVDTESNSLFAYREQVCLVQFSTRKADYLVDPLRIHDLSGLAALFSNPRIQKVFHAAEYDLICLKRGYDFKFNNIFDTMQAGRILGKKNLGLAGMLEEYFGLEIDKKFQRANWGQRPLADDMKEYAHRDTHYLIPLKNLLEKELAKRGLSDPAKEDFLRLTKVEPQSLEPDENTWQVPGCQKLDTRQCTVLKQLWEMREKFARQQNRPVFKVMSTQDLLELALACPQNARDLMKVDTVSHSILERYQDAILAAIHAGMNTPLVHMTRQPKPSQAYLRRVDRLKEWRTSAAKKLEVESDIIMPRETLETIARVHPHNPVELKAILAGQSWRNKKFGHEILELINPKERE